MRNLVALALAGTLALPLTARPETTGSGETQEREDHQITQSIREALVRAEDLSAAARSAEIITEEGEVTLRGPVATADEKQRLGALAQGTPGVVRIRNELEVKRR